MTTPTAAPAAPVAAAPTAAAPVIAPAAPAAPVVPAAPAAPAAAPTIDSLIPADVTPAATVAPAAPAAAPADPNSGKAWLLAEGVLGTGDPPEFFKKDKYATLADQAKAYTELEKRFGSFVGAPKDGKYDIALPAEIGVELESEHPLLTGFQKWSTDNNLSQKGFTELMGMLGQYEAQNMVNMDEVKSELGEQADARIAASAQWAKANLDAEGYQTFRKATTGKNAADVFKVVEAVIGKSKQITLPKPGQDVFNAQPEGLEKIKAEHGRKGADGKLLYDTSPEHRRKVEAAYTEYYNKS